MTKAEVLKKYGLSVLPGDFSEEADETFINNLLALRRSFDPKFAESRRIADRCVK